MALPANGVWMTLNDPDAQGKRILILHFELHYLDTTRFSSAAYERSCGAAGLRGSDMILILCNVLTMRLHIHLFSALSPMPHLRSGGLSQSLLLKYNDMSDSA